MIKSNEIQNLISELSNNIRAEYMNGKRYINLFHGTDIIASSNNKKNQMIVGRRGTGKTHLLKVLQETVANSFEIKRELPVYMDLRNSLPIISNSSENELEIAIIILLTIVQEIVKTIGENINTIFSLNEFDDENKRKFKLNELGKLFSNLCYKFNGNTFEKFNDLSLNEEEVKKISAGFNISKNPSININAEGQRTVSTTKSISKYITLSEIADSINEILQFCMLNRIILLLDEWSELPQNTQLYLAELLKRCLITTKITFKIAVIPNRVKIGEKQDNKFVGLETGGDIFSLNLDNRYVYELNPEITKEFYNHLLYKHLSNIDTVKSVEENKDNILNYFLTKHALNEILVASAGIPRDFLQLFINSYELFFNSSGNQVHIGIKHIKAAANTWFEIDKLENVEKDHNAKVLLDSLIQEILSKHKVTHFLIPHKYSQHKELNNLIDYRVVHLRKNGYSHKGKPGVVYDVYSLDYGCYSNLRIEKNNIDTTFVESVKAINDLREIRRISLEDNFFEKLLLEIGEGIKCPHCKKTVDVGHLAYIKQGLCNNCFEKIE